MALRQHNASPSIARCLITKPYNDVSRSAPRVTLSSSFLGLCFLFPVGVFRRVNRADFRNFCCLFNCSCPARAAVLVAVFIFMYQWFLVRVHAGKTSGFRTKTYTFACGRPVIASKTSFCSFRLPDYRFVASCCNFIHVHIMFNLFLNLLFLLGLRDVLRHIRVLTGAAVPLTPSFP